MKKNVAKINLVVSSCNGCPYSRDAGKVSVKCVHDLSGGLDVGDGDYVPDFCPFVLQRLQKVIDYIKESNNSVVPKIYVYKVGRKQQEGLGGADAKYSADHSFLHVKNVQEYGIDFLHACVDAGFSSPDTIQKEILLFELAAYMHDIGMADSSSNHAIHSSEIAKRFLLKQDVDEDDAMTIVRAIANHSDGKETRTIIDAALVLADKLDMTHDRIINGVDNITRMMLKINKVSYSFYRKKGKVVGAKLEYETSGLNGEDIISIYPKSVSIPKMVTKKYLKLPEFQFIVDGATIDVDKLSY